MTPDDRELDDYLAGRSRVSARYRAASVETTTPELDRAVLDQARAALRTAPVSKPSWQQRWAVPVGIAATLLIGVDLAWRVSDRARIDDSARETAAIAQSNEAATTGRSESASSAAPGLEDGQTRVSPVAVPAPPDASGVGVSEQRRLRQESTEVAADDLASGPVPFEIADSELKAMEADRETRADVAVDAQSAEAAGAAPQSADAQTAAPDEDLDVLRAEQALRAAKARSAQRRAEAPLAAMAAAAPAPETEPVIPRRSAAAARSVADEVSALLRARDFDGLRQRYQAAALTRPALEGAAQVFDGELKLRLIEDADGTWRADYLDANDQLRCALRLRPTEHGWSLVGLATRP